MAANNLYMPFHVGDYLADAGHLSALETGAYMLLIMAYWHKGEALPANERVLRGICKLTDEQWEDVGEVVLPFFHERDGKLHHKRIDIELERARDKSSKAKASAERMLNNRRANAERTLSDGSANQEQEQVKEEASASSYSAKPSRQKRRSQIAEDAEPTAIDMQEAAAVGMTGETFDFQWRKFRDYHRAKGSLMADWPAAWRTWCGNYSSFNAPKVVPFSHGPPRGKPSVTDVILDLLAEERAR